MMIRHKVAAYAASIAVILVVETSPRAPFGVTFISAAHAIVGAPVTPGSVAGVARRTTRRTVAVASSTAASQSAAQAATAQQQSATAQQQSATAQQQSATAQQQAAVAAQQPASAPAPAGSSGQALPLGTVVPALPAGCTQVTQGGVQYSKCGANYYRAAFQGSNLVYVTAQP
jgi:hypothetical protein